MTFILPVLALLLGWFLLRRFQMKLVRAREAPQRLFHDILPLFTDSDLKAGEAVGSWSLTGKRSGHVFQVSVITDTLATRKLPVLWLMVTLPEAQDLEQTFDLMMRPSGPTTFSKFDFLPETLALPFGFPPEAIIRSDRPGRYPADAVRPHLNWFQAERGKEILISPKGLRVVLQVAEADRARYGVLRQAEFGDAKLNGKAVAAAADVLMALKQKIG